MTSRVRAVAAAAAAIINTDSVNVADERCVTRKANIIDEERASLQPETRRRRRLTLPPSLSLSSFLSLSLSPSLCVSSSRAVMTYHDNDDYSSRQRKQSIKYLGCHRRDGELATTVASLRQYQSFCQYVCLSIRIHIKFREEQIQLHATENAP